MQIRKKKRIREGMVEHLTIGNHIANCIIHFCLIMVAVISLLPMWHVLMSSVSDGFSLLSYKGVAVVPIGKPTLEGYRLIFRDASVWIGYKNTIIYVAGTVGLGFVLNVLGGYALSQPTKGKGIMYAFLFVTMLFSGGIVPTYMVMNTLGLTGSRLSIILLEATQTFYLIFASQGLCGSAAFHGGGRADRRCGTSAGDVPDHAAPGEGDVLHHLAQHLCRCLELLVQRLHLCACG